MAFQKNTGRALPLRYHQINSLDHFQQIINIAFIILCFF